MTTNVVSRKDKPSFITRTWNWFRAVDEAMNYDPVEKLQQRVDWLEHRFEEITSKAEIEKRDYE